MLNTKTFATIAKWLISFSCLCLLLACQNTHYADLTTKQRTIFQFSQSELIKRQANKLNHQALLNHLQILASDEFAGRQYRSVESKLAKDYIAQKLTSFGVAPYQDSYFHHFNSAQETVKITDANKNALVEQLGTNIIGFIQGTGKTNKVIVLSAHFDHVGTKGNKIYNGADDNASGTATLLELGRAIANAPLQHNVVLLFTDGEESNLLGAKAFAKDNAQLLDKTILNVNLDMLAGANTTQRLRFIERKLHAVLTVKGRVQFEQLNEHAKLPVRKGFKQANMRGANNASARQWLFASDHGVFYRHNIAFIYFGVGTHKNYHTENDNYANVNKPFFVKASDHIYQLIYVLDQNMQPFG